MKKLIPIALSLSIGVISFSVVASESFAQSESNQFDDLVKAIADAQVKIFSPAVSFCAINQQPKNRSLYSSFKSYIEALSTGTKAAAIEISKTDKEFIYSGPTYQSKDFEIMESLSDTTLNVVQYDPAKGCAQLGTYFESGTSTSFKERILQDHRDHQAKSAKCCSSHPSPGDDYISTSQVADRLHRKGFSVAPPRGQGWVTHTKEKSSHGVHFHRALSNKSHTFIASATIGQLEQGIAFEQAAMPHGFFDAARHELLDSKVEPDNSRNTPCIRYTIRLLVKYSPNSPDTPLHMLERGIVCAHPTIANTSVRASFSERGIPAELDESLWADLEYFISGLRIE